jgi:hypothetical protein
MHSLSVVIGHLRGGVAFHRCSPLGSGFMIAEHGIGCREREVLGAEALPSDIPVPAQACEPRTE